MPGTHNFNLLKTWTLHAMCGSAIFALLLPQRSEPIEFHHEEMLFKSFERTTFGCCIFGKSEETG